MGEQPTVDTSLEAATAVADRLEATIRDRLCGPDAVSYEATLIRALATQLAEAQAEVETYKTLAMLVLDDDPNGVLWWLGERDIDIDELVTEINSDYVAKLKETARLQDVAVEVRPLTIEYDRNNSLEAFGVGIMYSAYESRGNVWRVVAYPYRSERVVISNNATSRDDALLIMTADHEKRILATIETVPTSEVRREALEDGFLAGFNASIEGWNGEYPFRDYGQNPVHDDEWLDCRDEEVRQLINKEED